MHNIFSTHRYKNKLTIRMHFLYRHKQKPVICPICGKLSPNKKALTVHKRIHREDYKERFKCPICEKGFRDRTKLRVFTFNVKFSDCAFFFNKVNNPFGFLLIFRNIPTAIQESVMPTVATTVKRRSAMVLILANTERRFILLKKIFGKLLIILV